MYKFSTTKRFDKALKVCQKRGYSIAKLKKPLNCWLKMEVYLHNTNHILFMETITENGRLI